MRAGLLFKLWGILYVWLCLAIGLSQAQTTPPGLQGTNLVTWLAFTAQQAWSPRLTTQAFAGASTQSDPDNWNPTQKFGVFVLNQETFYQLRPGWRVALCNSYRLYGNYAQAEPYDLLPIGYRQELRVYARLNYRHSVHPRWELSYTLRPEYRMFYTQQWEDLSPSTSIRTRAGVQATYTLSPRQALVLGAEAFGDTREDGLTWSPYRFTQVRAAGFWQTRPSEQTILNLGVMQQQLYQPDGWGRSATYLSAEVVWVNPLGLKR